MVDKQLKSELKKALKYLMRWTSMKDWDIVLLFAPLENKLGESRIQSEYKQATIVINSEFKSEIHYKNDALIMTLCHEFVHVWLWDLHNPETYENNLSYNRLVEGCVEMTGRTLYHKVLKPAGF